MSEKLPKHHAPSLAPMAPSPATTRPAVASRRPHSPGFQPSRAGQHGVDRDPASLLRRQLPGPRHAAARGAPGPVLLNSE